ncbi:hypothetical protein PSH87_13105 [Pseudomonas sp. FP453]|uniref:hypothetical protein n=1 Tax=Pseudomonas sp. FP453 TaxID=2954094 RepID=UPI0027337949|nr:hypothetical protein [Pseudomonas sp. FP453]WLH92842.1 hypothetical protein PSH87_13105 [Pseudomonas sp. FP453]
MSSIHVNSADTAFNRLFRAPQPPAPSAQSRPETAPADRLSGPPPNTAALQHEGRPQTKTNRSKRDATTPGIEPTSGSVTASRLFPASDVAQSADVTLQENMVHWLNTGHAKEELIPPNASISSFLEMYDQAIKEPPIQAWFKSKGLKLSTVRVFSDSVVGVVVVNGKQSFQRFTTTDGSGWWEVSAKVSALHKVLSPNDLGIPVAPGPTQGPVPRDVVLDFYGVKPPLNEKAAPRLGKQLQQEGWPGISQAQRAQWEKQFKQLQQHSGDSAVRERLGAQLQPLIKNKQGGDELTLNEQAIWVEPGSSLDQASTSPREQFVEFLASAAFKAFLGRAGVAGLGSEFRITEGDLQMLRANGQWISLQDSFDADVELMSGHGSANEQATARKFNEDFDRLVQQSEKAGNALYSTRRYDMRQTLAYYAPDVPQTVGQMRAALQWFNTKLPSPPLAGDYAGMTPYVQTEGSLSSSSLETMKAASAGVMSLLKGFSGRPSFGQSFHDPDRQLADFFDSSKAIAKADEIAKALKLYSVAEGQALSRAERHQLLATALKLSVDATMPGVAGQVAGYSLYQPGNLGRSLKEVRDDVEMHLESKGVDAGLTPLVAHLFLAQSAPEMLVKADTRVPEDARQVLNQDPQNVKVGSTGWLELRQGCAIADTLSGPGSSRLMNFTQVMALSRLDASGPNQEYLQKSLATKPLLDWGVMAGIFPATADGHYSPGDYKAAAQAFTEREDQTRDAFNTLTSEPPTQTTVLIKELVRLFPEMTEEELRTFKLELDTDVKYDSRQHGHMETRQPLLTDVILTNQVDDDPLLLLDRLVNYLVSGEKKYKFNHPKISQATFLERIKQLPKIKPLVAPAVDQYIADTRVAQATALKLMLAQLPLEDRRALESGKIEFFSVRKETGEALEDDQGPDSKVASNRGTHGLLLRYETGLVTPWFGYYEVFPGSMQMVKRTDLPDRLPLGGETKAGRKPHGPFAYVQTPFQRGTEQPFDFDAYSTGSPPKPGAKSMVIIEKTATELPATTEIASRRVPNTFSSNKTARMVETFLAHSFDGKRDALLEHANQPTTLHSRRTYPFASGKMFSSENARLMLRLIPFVGAVFDFAQGKVAEGLTGLLIDFASFIATGGLVGARQFFSGMKMLIPFSRKAFSMAGLKGAGSFFMSVFNPLAGAVDVLKAGPKSLAATRKILMGEAARVGPGIYMINTIMEKIRWIIGAKDTPFTGIAPSAGQWPGSRFGTSQNREMYAIQKNGQWYAIDSTTLRPTGAPLAQFTPQPG